MEVATEQQLCVSLVAPGPLLYITVQTSCVKEIDRETASNQQLPPQAIHMHTPCDVPKEQQGSLSLNLKCTSREKIYVCRITQVFIVCSSSLLPLFSMFTFFTK